MARIDQVGDSIYRISVFTPEKRISFNQFVIDDERPALVHTGQYPMYEEVREAVSQVLDPSRLAYVIVPHFESDECGGMGRFVAEAEQAVLVCSAVGARINLLQWDYAGPVQGVQDGDVVDLGKHRLRILETPHVHHWDSMMAFDETTRSCSHPICSYSPGSSHPSCARIWGRTCASGTAPPASSAARSRCSGSWTIWRHSIPSGSTRCTEGACRAMFCRGTCTPCERSQSFLTAESSGECSPGDRSLGLDQTIVTGAL